jgi:mono/diheme cytochrome c family protein
MPRQVTWGTPSRTNRYLQPRPAYARVLRALAAGAAVAAFLLAFHFTRWREPLMPGALVAPHSNIESCQECHAPRVGASDVRCERCHDPSGAGRLVQSAHVSQVAGAGRRNAGDPQLAGERQCASCHVEHRGRDASLRDVPEQQCLSCHAVRRPETSGQRFRIASFASHPEFRPLRDRLREAPGLEFTHDRHVREVRKKLDNVQPGATNEMTCGECHQFETRAHDFAPISYDAHCASCHQADLAMEPVAEADVLAPETSGDLARSEGKVALRKAAHKDDWIVRNVRLLQSELHPEAYAAARGRVLARAAVLRRRLVLAEPLAGLELSALQDRRDALDLERQWLEARIGAQETAAPAHQPPGRREELAAALAASGDAQLAAEAERWLVEAEAVPAAAGMSAPQFEAACRRLLALVDAVAASDPALRPRADYLRMRLLALAPGESGLEGLKRARRQRARETDRIRDEIALRGSGVAPTALPDLERRAIARALAEAEEKVREFPEPAAAALTDAARAGKEESLRALTGAPGERCAKCHEIRDGGFAPVVASKPVLVLSAFLHEPHLRAAVPSAPLWRRLTRSAGAASGATHASCTYCHEGITTSSTSADLHLMSVQSCRECHRPGGARQDCQSCHRYHPPGFV